MNEKLNMPWRRSYEAYAAAGWTVGTIALFVIAYERAIQGPLMYVATITTSLAIYRWHQSLSIWNRQANLLGRPLSWVDVSVLVKWAKGYEDWQTALVRFLKAKPVDKRLWLGKGFDWRREHVQSIYEVKKYGPEKLKPPMLYHLARSALGIKTGTTDLGTAWIHGIEKNEIDITMPVKDLANHTVIFGMTGSGKTRLYEILMSQCIHRGETVVCLDPKGDQDLRKRIQNECVRAGRADAFLNFHPAFPSASVRIDPLRNWNKITEIASRVDALLPPNGRDAFKDFAWRAIALISEGLVFTGQRPSLMTLRKFIEGGPEPLLYRALQMHLERHVEEWETRVSNTSVPKKRKESNASAAETEKMIRLYKEAATNDPKIDSQVINGLINMFEHDREHLGKMLASLIPVLTMITSGSLADLLSPDPMNTDDPRPLIDTKRIISGKHVLYVGLDSLPDKTVGSAIGSIFLADLTSVAGSIANFGGDGGIINVFCDEASEIVNEQLVSLLNKSRSSGFRIYIAAQTFPDFIARTGNEAMARQLLGNAGNLIALRTLDRMTQDFIIESFGKETIYKLGESQNTNALGHDANVLTASGSYGERLSEEDVDKVTSDILAQLPNLEYFARISGNRIVKGRLSLIRENNEIGLEEQTWIKTRQSS